MSIDSLGDALRSGRRIVGFRLMIPPGTTPRTFAGPFEEVLEDIMSFVDGCTGALLALLLDDMTRWVYPDAMCDAFDAAQRVNGDVWQPAANVSGAAPPGPLGEPSSALVPARLLGRSRET